MKILHIVDYLMPTMGYQEFLLPKWNKKQNQDVYILTSNLYYPVPNYNQTWKKFLGERLRKSGNTKIEGVKITRKNILFEINSRPWIKGLKNAIIDINPDIIMVHGTASISAIRVAVICRIYKIPCMFDNHMVFSVVKKTFFAKVYYFLIKTVVKKMVSNVAYKVIGVTSETCKYLKQNEGYSSNKIYHLPLGIDDKVFYPKQNKKSKKFKIIQTGKLNDDKKPQWTAMAVLELLKKGKNIELSFIGKGSSKIKKQIIDQFYKNNFSKNLKFIDFLDQKGLCKAYNETDLCIFPEGTSLSALEVSACKKPVIMADYLASLDRQKEGIGITYKTGNIKDLKNKISKLIENNKYYKNICERSYRGVKKKYTYENISKVFINLCKQAISENNDKK